MKTNETIKEIKAYDEGEYHSEIKPYQKNWRECDKIQVVVTLKIGNEKKIFKGLISLTGIIKGDSN